jgi:hypothetical protein
MNVAMVRKDTGEGFRAPWLVFWVAFAVRVLYITLAHTYRIKTYDDHLPFGQEMGRIARSVATGLGFSDPFRGHTGPTAWVGPLYPLLVGGVFKLFGVFSAQSAWVIFTINSLFSALTARTIWEIGTRCFNRNVARWSAWIWALSPAAMQYAVRWVWEMSLSAFLFSWVLVVALRMRGCNGDRMGASAGPSDMTTARWALLGVLWGLAGLSNPAPTGWGTAGGGAVYRLSRTLDLEELGGLPPLRAHAGEFRRRVIPGQRTGSERVVDGIRSPHAGAGPNAPVRKYG